MALNPEVIPNTPVGELSADLLEFIDQYAFTPPDGDPLNPLDRPTTEEIAGYLGPRYNVRHILPGTTLNPHILFP